MRFLKNLILPGSYRPKRDELHRMREQVDSLTAKLSETEAQFQKAKNDLQAYQMPHIVNRIETLTAKVGMWKKLVDARIMDPDHIPQMMRDIEECAQKTHLASALLNGEKIQNADES